MTAGADGATDAGSAAFVTTWPVSVDTPSLAYDLPIAGWRDAGATGHPRAAPHVVRNGVPIIYDTRTAMALMRARVPQSQWAGVNVTGVPFFEAQMTLRLEAAQLGLSGSVSPPMLTLPPGR